MREKGGVKEEAGIRQEQGDTSRGIVIKTPKRFGSMYVCMNEGRSNCNNVTHVAYQKPPPLYQWCTNCYF